MKYLLSVLAVFGAVTFSTAQTVKFGIKSGINLSEMTSTKNSLNDFPANAQTLETSSTTNFHVGGFIDIRYKNISIQPGLTYITKGGVNYVANNDNSSSFQRNEKLTIHYIEVPVNLLLNLPVGVGEIFFGGGPYLDMGLSGTDETKHTALGTPTTIKAPINFGDQPYMLYGDAVQTGEVKNPAFGINTLAGFKLKNGLLISAGYGFNLTQIANNKDQTAKLNSVIFSVGYCF